MLVVINVIYNPEREGDRSSYTNIADNVSELSTITEVCMVYKEVPCSE